MWVAGGCEPRAPDASVEWHSRHSWSTFDARQHLRVVRAVRLVAGQAAARHAADRRADVLVDERTPLLVVAGQARQLALPRQLERALALAPVGLVAGGAGEAAAVEVVGVRLAPQRGGLPRVAGGAKLRLALGEELRLLRLGRVDGVAGEAVHDFRGAVDPVTVGKVLGGDVVTRQAGLGALGAVEALDERLVAARLHVGLPVAVAARAGRVAGQLAGRSAVRVRRRTSSTARGSLRSSERPQQGPVDRSTSPRGPGERGR